MDEFAKCMLVDRLLIVLGVLGVLIPVAALIMAYNGIITLDLTYVLFIPLGGFFIYYGLHQIEKDKETYHQK